MISDDEYTRHDAVGLSDLFQQGEVSASELLERALARTARYNPGLNAVVFQHEQEARAIAQEMDNTQRPTGYASLLAGVPFLIKEVNAVQGWPHTRGLQMLAAHRAQHDSVIVQRYRDAGLVVFGSTNTPELCLTITTEHSIFGLCDNPCKAGYSSGGSSGGAAAAVAAGIVPAADASDGGGSIRIPAACCGLIGLKPSRGLTAIEPDMSAAWSGLSVGHVLTRSVRDSAAFLDLLTLRKPGLFALPPVPSSCFVEHTRALGRLRIAVQTRHPAGAQVHDDCQSALRHAVRLCTNLGHSLEEAVLPVNYAEIGSAMATVINVHTAQIVSRAMTIAGVDSVDSAGLSESSRRMCVRGLQTSASTYLEALDTLKVAERRMELFFQQYDIVLSPVLAQPPAAQGWLDMNSDDIREYARRYASYSPFTGLYNGTGQPAISLPLYRRQDNLPVGVMASAAWGQDALLLQLAHQLIPGILPVHAGRQLL